MNKHFYKKSVLYLFCLSLFFLEALAIEEIESNDDIFAAQPITIPTTILGSISTSSSDTFDYFQFDIEQPTRISLDIESTSGKSIGLTLFRTFKLQAVGQSLGPGSTINPINALLKPGNYIIQVDTFSDFDNFEYTLNVTTSPIGQNPQLSLIGNDITLSATERNTTKLFVDAFNFISPTTCDAFSLDNSLLRITPKRFLLNAKKNSQILKATVPRVTAFSLINNNSSEFVTVQVFCKNGAIANKELFLSTP